MGEIEHVFFDLDRTLWDFETNSKATLEELFAELNLATKLGVSDQEFIKEYKRINAIFWTDYRNGVIEKAELRYARFETAMKYFGYEDRKLASKMGELYISRSPRKTNLVPGTIDILEYLKPKYHLHIITNGFEEVQEIKMNSSGLSRYFEHVITSEEAGAKKPSKVIFDYAEKLTGAKPSNSIMIGDDFDADIEGAVKANWKAVFFEPNCEFSEMETYTQIQNLSELKNLL